MKAAVFALVLLGVCYAEEEKKTEKRGVVGLGYGGLGYPGFDAYPGYHGLPLGYNHGFGVPYHGGYPLGHGFAAPALHAPLISKTVAPIAPVSYAAPLHAPILSKTIAPVSHFGYSSPYFGYNHGYPGYLH